MVEYRWPMPDGWWRARRSELAIAAAASAVEILERCRLGDDGAALARARENLAIAEAARVPYPDEAR